MRWQIKGFVFCGQLHTLTNEHDTVRIEPMVSELLTYFCQHQKQIISKEQLINDVWRGRFVSDNTVSKLITKLRKALADDARNPQYIVTLPKRGYRFVATATLLEQVTDTTTAQTPPEAQTSKPTSTPITEHQVSDKNTRTTRKTIATFSFVAVLVVVILMTAWLFNTQQASPKVAASAKAVTSDRGREYFPHFANDGVRLAYMNHDGEKYRLFVKNVYSGEQVEVKHDETDGVGPGNWNKTGTKLVYLVGTPERCQYFIREFNGLEMSEPKLIYSCNAGSFGAIKFTHDDNLLVFSESQSRGTPYSLYSLSLDKGQTQWLPQPDIHIGGNSQFDLHPTVNKLLISSPDEQQYEGFYQLDLTTNKLDLLFKLNAYICCGIWSHDGEHVVLMGEHPAREIKQYDLDGTGESVIYTGTQQIQRPERHSNGVDYNFIGFHSDLNVEQYTISEDKTQSILNDSFDERLAQLSPDNEQIAYISLTTGNEELWLYHRNSQRKKKITDFADGRHYIDLTWSPEHTKVAALGLNAIDIIDLQTGQAKQLPLPEREIRGLSFKSSDKLAFSMRLENSWQVVVYDLAQDTMERLDPKWQSVRYSHSPQDWLWVDQQGQWYQGEDATPLSMPFTQASVFYGRQFNVKKSGEYLAKYDWQTRLLSIYKQGNELPVAEISSQIGHYSLRDGIVLVSQKASNANESDIYQTFQLN